MDHSRNEQDLGHNGKIEIKGLLPKIKVQKKEETQENHRKIIEILET